MKRLLPYFGFLRPHWKTFAAALLCGVGFGVASGFGLPFMTKEVFPKIFPKDTGDERLVMGFWELALYVAWFPLAFFVRGVCGYFNTYLISYCGARVLERVRFEVFAKLQRLPRSFFQRNKEGDLLSRVFSDSGQLQRTVTGVGNDLIKQPVTFLGALSVLVYMALSSENMAFVLLCLLVIPLCVFPVRRIGKLLMGRALRMQEQAGGMTSVFSENLSAVTEVRAFNLQEREKRRFRQTSEKYLGAHMKVVKYGNMLSPIIEVLTSIGIAAAIFQAARLQVGLDEVVPVIVALYMAYEPVKKLGGIHNQVKQGLASLDRLEDILNEPETVREPEEPREIHNLKGEIRFENVSYHYQEENGGQSKEAALKGLDLTLKAGETVALVGPSGGGKTTLARLLPRFDDPTEGQILLDGVDLRELSLKGLRDAVAIVPQRPFLFDYTVRENVELGRTERTAAQVEEACQTAHAHEFVKEFPDAYEHRLGEHGSRLSGGQLQRLALARAFFKNAPILVLDEATSALDSDNEERIREAMSELVKGKTTLLIAHRFSSLKLADRILVMDSGSIVGDGTHDELYQHCPLYKRLYDRQLGESNGAAPTDSAKNTSSNG